MTTCYHLYLDESETHQNGKNRVFSIAGIIVEENYHNTTLTNNVNLLKSKVWSDYPTYKDNILHEKDIRFASNPHNKYKLNDVDIIYRRFQNKKMSQSLYAGLEKIIRDKEITVIGGCIVFDELHKYFSKDILPDREIILLQIVLENFCHYLKLNCGTGKVFYEYIGDSTNKNMSMRFHQIKSTGTMYINPYSLQQFVKNIEFPFKKDNIPGLQIADFIPNDLARNAINKKKHIFSLNKEINRSIYDGGLNRKDKYGVKIIPRIT